MSEVNAVEKIEEKIKEIQNKHTVLTKNKQEKIAEINKINEELIQLVGAYNELTKLKDDLLPTEPRVEDIEEKVECCGNDCEQCECEKAESGVE